MSWEERACLRLHGMQAPVEVSRSVPPHRLQGRPWYRTWPSVAAVFRGVSCIREVVAEQHPGARGRKRIAAPSISTQGTQERGNLEVPGFRVSAFLKVRRALPVRFPRTAREWPPLVAARGAKLHACTRTQEPGGPTSARFPWRRRRSTCLSVVMDAVSRPQPSTDGQPPACRAYVCAGFAVVVAGGVLR
ncbi:MAG: hypothetical protein RL148_232 [Planctomycetota bacterium]